MTLLHCAHGRECPQDRLVRIRVDRRVIPGPIVFITVFVARMKHGDFLVRMAKTIVSVIYEIVVAHTRTESVRRVL